MQRLESLLSRVGFPYMASVTWQAGLFHPSRGGLWLTTSYGKGQWGNNPIKGVQSANVTALSAATYFTLLAQGRLVDDVSSKEMQTWLRGGCMTKHFHKAWDWSHPNVVCGRIIGTIVL